MSSRSRILVIPENEELFKSLRSKLQVSKLEQLAPGEHIVTLPERWVYTEAESLLLIKDEAGRVRYVQSYNLGRAKEIVDVNWWVVPFYEVRVCSLNSGSVVPLFSVGIFCNGTDKYVSQMGITADRVSMVAGCKEFLTAKYANWEDPNAYW